MKPVIALAAWLACSATAQAQVHVDRSVVMTGANEADRRIEGLAPATTGTALIAPDDARAGRYHLAQTGGTAMAITLAMDPPCTAYGKGLTVRFKPLANAAGKVTLNVNGLGPKALVRGDGTPVAFGLLAAGRMAEAVYADTAFVLSGRDPEGCPSGFVQANDRLCFQRNDTLNMSIYNASRWCMERGARLCTWDEYIFACTATQGDLQGLYDDWEWIDDTSDHTHTADQSGRWQCRSQRAVGATEASGNFGGVRCCYHLR